MARAGEICSEVNSHFVAETRMNAMRRFRLWCGVGKLLDMDLLAIYALVLDFWVRFRKECYDKEKYQ
jgi:cytosine/uracil/thiamine/allantoin permease